MSYNRTTKMCFFQLKVYFYFSKAADFGVYFSLIVLVFIQPVLKLVHISCVNDIDMQGIPVGCYSVCEEIFSLYAFC